MSFADPAALPSLLSKARIAQRSGRTDEARALFSTAVRQAPRDASVLLEAGVLEASLGNHKAAERLLDKALKLDPAQADIHYNLGQIAREAEHLEKAVRLFRRTVALDPVHADALYALGEALYAQGKAEEALPHLGQARAAAPGDAEAAHVHALCLDHLGREDEAEAAYRDVLRIAPGHVHAKLNLALLIAQRNVSEEPKRLVAEVRDGPGIPTQALALAARVLTLVGENDEGLALADRAIAEGVQVGEARAARARAFMDAGSFDEAESELRQILKSGRSTAYAYYCLGLIKRLSPDAEPDIRRRAGDPSRPVSERSQLNFALYYLRDQAGRYDEAFESLAEANRLRAQAMPFNAERHRLRTSEIIETYSPQFIEECRKHGHSEPGGIYVAGMPRSGTTLTEQILAAHSLVHAGGESLDVAHTVKAMAGWPGNAATLSPEDFKSQGQRLHAGLFARASDKAFATDKTPGNFMLFGAIACALPAAKLVYVKRSPADNAISLFDQSFQMGLSYSYDLTSLGIVYREHQRLMRHWIETCGLPVHVVDYDALVTDPEPHVRKLLEFVGLEFEPDCLTPNAVRRDVRTNSFWQVRQPINAKSVGRWRRYEGQMQPFFRALEGES